MIEPRHPSAVTSAPPPEAWEPLIKLARLATRPLERFLRIEAASGLLLMLSALIALVWANSPWGESYQHLWHLPVGVRLGDWHAERSLEWVVNDALMVVFFFVVGLEIKRELHQGELSEWRRALLPAAAALGGMIVPAAIYAWLTKAPAGRPGWGVPMATDIAFAVGVLALLGRRVPPALRVLLLALAVIDDLGAIVVIALFYSGSVAVQGLLLGLAGVLLILLMQRLGVRSRAAYLFPGVVVWAGVAASGVHPTIAGVIVGLLTPVRAWLGTEGFLTELRDEVSQLPEGAVDAQAVSVAVRRLERARRETLSPAEGLIERLHPWVAFGVMPLFALANAGVVLGGVSLDDVSGQVIVGAATGLLLGKPIGVLLAVAVVRLLGVGVLPAGLGRAHLLVLGLVAGVGFTMSLFVAQLAFADATLLAAAKAGVLGASVVAGVIAYAAGRLLLAETRTPGVAVSADAAESSTEA